ncbi:MAG: ABC transporter, partial [Ruminococcus bromii]
RKLIRNLGKKHTVIFSSHVLSEVSEVCDRIVVISKGKIVADAKTDELSAQVSGGQKLSLVAEGSTADITEAIKKIPAVKHVAKTGSNVDGSGRYMIEYETASDIRRDVYNAMVRIGAVILDMQSGNETLEDMFLKLTSGKYDSRKEDM